MNANQSMLIRHATTADLNQCAALIDETPFFTNYGMDGAKVAAVISKSVQTDGAICVTLLDGESVLGFAWLLPKGGFDRSAYLKLLAVNPHKKRRGIGARLMAHLEQNWLKPNGLMLLVTEDNEHAVRFYQSIGYTQRGRLPDYVQAGRTELLMYKAPVGQ